MGPKVGTSEDLNPFPDSRELRWLTVRQNHGRRFGLFEREGVPRGYVVNGCLPDELMVRIKGEVWPLMPGGGCTNALAALGAKRELRDLGEKYGGEVMMILVRDDEPYAGGWNYGPVLVRDLQRKAEELVEEMMASSREEDRDRAEMLRRAWLAMTGNVDTQ